MTTAMTPKARRVGMKQDAQSRAVERKDTLSSQVKGAWAKSDRAEAKQTGRPQLIRRV